MGGDGGGTISGEKLFLYLENQSGECGITARRLISRRMRRLRRSGAPGHQGPGLANHTLPHQRPEICHWRRHQDGLQAFVSEDTHLQTHTHSGIHLLRRTCQSFSGPHWRNVNQRFSCSQVVGHHPLLPMWSPPALRNSTTFLCWLPVQHVIELMVSSAH